MFLLIGGVAMAAVGAAFVIFNSYGDQNDEDADTHLEMKHREGHTRGRVRPPIGSPRHHKAFSPKGNNQFHQHDLEYGHDYIEYDHARNVNRADVPREPRQSRHGSYHPRSIHNDAHHVGHPERRSRSHSRSRWEQQDPHGEYPDQRAHQHGYSEQRSRSHSRSHREPQRYNRSLSSSRHGQVQQYVNHDPNNEHLMNGGGYDGPVQHHRSERRMGSSRHVEGSYYVRQE